MELIRKIHINNKEVLIIDYTYQKVTEMMSTFNAAKQLVLTEGKPVLVLSMFKKNYVTPQFMRHLEKEMGDVEHLIHKNAVVGLSEIQLWILKGMNLWYKRQVYHFKTIDEASAFLTSH